MPSISEDEQSKPSLECATQLSFLLGNSQINVELQHDGSSASIPKHRSSNGIADPDSTTSTLQVEETNLGQDSMNTATSVQHFHQDKELSNQQDISIPDPVFAPPSVSEDRQSQFPPDFESLGKNITMARLL